MIVTHRRDNRDRKIFLSCNRLGNLKEREFNSSRHYAQWNTLRCMNINRFFHFIFSFSTSVYSVEDVLGWISGSLIHSKWIWCCSYGISTLTPYSIRLFSIIIINIIWYNIKNIIVSQTISIAFLNLPLGNRTVCL